MVNISAPLAEKAEHLPETEAAAAAQGGVTLQVTTQGSDVGAASSVVATCPFLSPVPVS